MAILSVIATFYLPVQEAYALVLTERCKTTNPLSCYPNRRHENRHSRLDACPLSQIAKGTVTDAFAMKLPFQEKNNLS